MIALRSVFNPSNIREAESFTTSTSDDSPVSNFSRSSSISRMMVAVSSVNRSYFVAMFGAILCSVPVFDVESSESFECMYALQWNCFTNFPPLVSGQCDRQFCNMTRYGLHFNMFHILFVVCRLRCVYFHNQQSKQCMLTSSFEVRIVKLYQ